MHHLLVGLCIYFIIILYSLIEVNRVLSASTNMIGCTIRTPPKRTYVYQILQTLKLIQRLRSGKVKKIGWKFKIEFPANL